MRIFTRLLLVALVFYQGYGLNSLVVEHFSHAKAHEGESGIVLEDKGSVNFNPADILRQSFN